MGAGEIGSGSTGSILAWRRMTLASATTGSGTVIRLPSTMTPTTTAGTWHTTLGSARTFTCSTWATNGDESDKHLRAGLHASGGNRRAVRARPRRDRRDLHVRVWPARLHAREVSPHPG